ncbi:MAG: hypothetical protein ACYDER_24000 [Ktedonobacteraceae bacterium]
MQVMSNQQKQHTQKRTSTAHFVFIYGTLIGLIPGILYIIMTVINVYPVLSNMLWILLIIYGAGFFLAGILAVQKTGKISAAVLAGLWSGAIGGCLTYVYILAALLLQPAMLASLAKFLTIKFGIQLNAPYNALTMNIPIQLVVIAIILAFLLTLVLSICLSFLGGIIGKINVRGFSYRQFNNIPPKD